MNGVYYPWTHRTPNNRKDEDGEREEYKIYTFLQLIVALYKQSSCEDIHCLYFEYISIIFFNSLGAGKLRMKE